jgi:hypothetical protein
VSGTATGDERDIDLDEHASRWFGEPVCVAEGPPQTLMKLIPRFDRRPFAMNSVGSRSLGNAPTPSAIGENDFYDLIVRSPLNQQESEIPVGIASKHYTLVQHLEVVERAAKAIDSAGVKLDQISAELTFSASGSKMAFTFTLPEKFDFDPGDKLILKLRFHCVNSVDGQCRLKIMLGWYRFVCGNGLVVGTSRLDQRFVHNSCLLYGCVNDICAVVDLLSDRPHSAGPIVINRSPPFANQRSAASTADGRTVVYTIATGARAPCATFALTSEAHGAE